MRRLIDGPDGTLSPSPTPSTGIPVVILAGGRLERSLAGKVAVSHKAWIPLQGEPMAARVLGTIAACPSLGSRVLVADPSQIPAAVRDMVHAIAPPGASMIESIASGCAAAMALQPGPKFLIVPCDVPVITMEAIEDFLARCRNRPAAAHYAYLSKEASQAAYPRVRHTYVRLADGTFCGGGLTLMEPDLIPQARTLMDRLLAARKAPWKLAGLLGWSVLFGLLTGRLTTAQAEARVSSLLGAPIAGIQTPYAEVGVNVDGAEDLEVVRALLGERA